MMKQRVENLPERIKTRRQKVSRTKEGLLSNAFTSSKWNSRIKSANTTKKRCGLDMYWVHMVCFWASL